MGKTGQAVARYLIDQGLACQGFDESATASSELNIELHLGALNADVLKQFSRLIVSPGVNWHHPALEAVRLADVPMYGDLELFGQRYQGDLIAITGTNGKTTTVTLISTMLDVLPGGIEAAGNIGRPMLELIDEVEPARVVLELSSFQIERANPIRPRWAALLNVQPDHADMHTDMASYTAAKLRLFAKQAKGDKAMLPADCEWDELAGSLRQRGVFVRRFGVGSANDLDAGVQCHDDGSWQVFWHHYDDCHTV